MSQQRLIVFKLTLSGLDEKDIQLTKSTYINTTAATRASAIIINTITTTVTTITTMPKGMKLKFSGNFKWGRRAE